jgi:hypothetical protein
VRGVEYVILALRPFQEVELDEAGNCIEMGVTAEPDVLEVMLAALFHLESIHGDEHFCSPGAKLSE